MPNIFFLSTFFLAYFTTLNLGPRPSRLDNVYCIHSSWANGHLQVALTYSNYYVKFIFDLSYFLRPAHIRPFRHIFLFFCPPLSLGPYKKSFQIWPPLRATINNPKRSLASQFASLFKFMLLAHYRPSFFGTAGRCNIRQLTGHACNMPAHALTHVRASHTQSATIY